VLISRNKKTTIKGFTIIELLIVMGIIAVLATFFIGGYTGVQRRARDGQRKSDLKQLANAMELYFNDYRRYPAESSTTIAGCPSTTTTSCTWGSGQFTDTKTVYFKTVPVDPTSSTYQYIYRTDANGTYYKLYARLEVPDDPDINASITQDGCHDDAPTVCNFAITSGNTTP